MSDKPCTENKNIHHYRQSHEEAHDQELHQFWQNLYS